MSLNHVVLIGRLTDSAALAHTDGHEPVPYCHFTIAVDRNYKNAQGEKETDFLRCTAWRHTAEAIVKYTGKGSQIAVDGSIQTRRYQDRVENRTSFEVRVNNVQFLDSRKRDDGPAPSDSDAPRDGMPF